MTGEYLGYKEDMHVFTQALLTGKKREYKLGAKYIWRRVTRHRAGIQEVVR